MHNNVESTFNQQHMGNLYCSPRDHM